MSAMANKGHIGTRHIYGLTKVFSMILFEVAKTYGEMDKRFEDIIE